MSSDSIIFPNLNIEFSSVGRGIDVFGFNIAFYGMVIALGMVIATFFILHNSKHYGFEGDTFLDIVIIGIICGVIGARLYYVIFSWDLYRDDLLSIFNLRRGGLGIYGGIIGGALGVFLSSRRKKIPFLTAGDVVIPGVVIGQICGRWGNFFNREAFGDYTNGIFAMGIPVDAVRSSSDLTPAMMDNILKVDGVSFVTVHPTFLYESCWNILVLIFLIFMRKRVKRSGCIVMLYLLLYGIGRFLIESLRTDQLIFFGTGVPVSMIVAAICVLFSAGWLIFYKPPKEQIEERE